MLHTTKAVLCEGVELYELLADEPHINLFCSLRFAHTVGSLLLRRLQEYSSLNADNTMRHSILKSPMKEKIIYNFSLEKAFLYTLLYTT